jgi:CP family cyanate transporter-like MFS transporter
MYVIVACVAAESWKFPHALADGLELELDDSMEAAPGNRKMVLAGGVLLGLAIVLIALNLRPAITSIGPMLDEMRASLGASATWAGVLTMLPGLCFAGAGLTAPLLARRFGIGTGLAAALSVMTAGLLLRVVDGPFVVLGGTLIATAGIALANVLIPVVIKDSFPAKIGLMTGVYTAALQGGGALGSSVTPPLAQVLGGWRSALGGWAVLGVIALVAWAFAARRQVPGEAESNRPAEARRSLLRNPLAWMVTLFFGLQAFLAYIVMGWLPQVLMDAGVSRGDTGLLLGLISLIAVPISLIVPPIAARQSGQSWWIVGLGVFGFAGMLGLLLAPGAAPLLWSVLVGLGMSVFSLALTVIALRARTGEETARLSGMAQGFGYLLAALGPFLFSMLHQLTGGWTVPLVMVMFVLVAQMVFGALAGRRRFVV